jgi:hypothetical protein
MGWVLGLFLFSQMCANPLGVRLLHPGNSRMLSGIGSSHTHHTSLAEMTDL